MKAHDLLKQEVCTERDTRFDALTGAAFLVSYFRASGITEEEIDLYRRWKGFWALERLLPNEDGLAYAKKRTDKLIAYRTMTVDDVLKNIDGTPWAWPTSMSFQKLYKPAPQTNADVCSIFICIYRGREYLFGIGKEEVPITDDMRQKGVWYVYTFCD